MNKLFFLFVCFLSFSIFSFAQTSSEKILFIIDSIPLLTDPEKWNSITQEDIADITIIKNKDTLKQLGWEQVDGIAYIFTKQYRNRPDSIKRLPSLKQMVMNNGFWYHRDTLYSGKYINYYNSGRIQSEGTLLDGKQNGALTVYFKNGNKKSVALYKDGLLHGTSTYYYTNGALSETREYTEGIISGNWQQYFINGQVETERRPKKQTSCDTFVVYYSSGKVKQMRLIRNKMLLPDKKNDDATYYSNKFNNYINTGDIKEANRAFYKLWLADSTSTDTYFKGGLLLVLEGRFDEAIAEFDKALQIEPMMRESLTYRAIARINKYKFPHAKTSSKSNQVVISTLEDIIAIPVNEQEKICSDLRQAEFIDSSEIYVGLRIPAHILNYCRNKSDH
jgi:tetratricopeptide (TPR) repeat protein